MEIIRIIELAENYLEKQGCEGSSLAKKLGFPPRYIADIKAGKSRNPGPNFILALINKMNFNPLWLETGEGSMFLLENHEKSPKNILKTGFKPLPVYKASEIPEKAFLVPRLEQKLSAGGGSYLPEDDETTALIPVPAYLSRFKDKIAVVTVDGDSMYPTLSRGDMVVCDSCGWSGEGIYAIRLNGSGFVKRLTMEPGKIVIISDNPQYKTYDEPKESQAIDIIGRVHCAIKQLE